jgi:uncharacterized membrane protein YGL010W
MPAVAALLKLPIQTISKELSSRAMSTKRLASYFEDYGTFHRTPANQLCHYIGIPLITIAVLGLLSGIVWLESGSAFLRLDAGAGLLILAAIWYVTLDWRLGVPFFLVTAGLYFVGRALPAWLLWGFFVVGWVFQLVGHGVYEKKSPAFLKNVEHLLIGPLWVFAKSIGYRSESR